MWGPVKRMVDKVEIIHARESMKESSELVHLENCHGHISCTELKVCAKFQDLSMTFFLKISVFHDFLKKEISLPLPLVPANLL